MFNNVKSELIYFIQLVSQRQTFVRDFRPSNRIDTGVKNYNKYRNYLDLINASCICHGFTLDLLDIDFLEIDFSGAD